MKEENYVGPRPPGELSSKYLSAFRIVEPAILVKNKYVYEARKVIAL